MRREIPAGIIALDLDGTLLNSKKELSDANLQALQKAAEQGFVIVPTTGRFYNAMPEVIKNLPFVEYAITINGAQVQDLVRDEIIYQAELPWEQAVSIMKYLEDYPLIYDCYMENDAYMTKALQEKIDETVHDEYYRWMLHALRNPVDELKEHVKERGLKGAGVQKVMFFTERPEVKTELLEKLPKVFENLAVSSSHVQNVEINQIRANKGEALMALAKYLGVQPEKTFSFGDGLNDLSMIEKAGVGIAMENGCEEVKAAADYITTHCDADGVAKAIEKFCLNTEK